MAIASGSKFGRSQENIERFELKQQCTLHFGDALHVLKGLQGPYDICYFDPPYTHTKGHTSDLVQSVLSLLDTSSLLAENALVFVEESTFADLSHLSLKHLTLQSTRKYGSSQLFCYTVVR